MVESASAVGRIDSATLGRHDRSAPPTVGEPEPFCRLCPLLGMARPTANTSTATSACNVTSQTSTSRRVNETSVKGSSCPPLQKKKHHLPSKRRPAFKTRNMTNFCWRSVVEYEISILQTSGLYVQWACFLLVVNICYFRTARLRLFKAGWAPSRQADFGVSSLKLLP